MADPVESAHPSPLPLVRNRDYLVLWFGQAVSETGGVAAGIAFPLLVLALSHSALQAGLVGAAQRVPFLILGLPAGALVDRWNRKLVMVLCDSARALAFLSVPVALWTGHLGMPVLYAVVLVEGLGFAFFNLAEVSVLPLVVDRSQIGQASANNQILWSSAAIVGPPLGGFLYSVSRALPFLADGVSYAFSVLSLLLIRRSFAAQPVDRPLSIRTEVMEGLRWLWARRAMRFLGILSGGVNLAYSGLPLAAIVLAQQDFHASSRLIGLLFAAVSLGGIGGALVAGRLHGRLTLYQSVMSGLWGMALFYPLMAVSPSLPALALVAVFSFGAGPIWDVAQFSYRVTRIPDRLQARVNSVYRIILFSGEPVGLAAAGFLIQAFGPRPAIGIMAGAMAVVALAATLNPDIREAR